MAAKLPEYQSTVSLNRGSIGAVQSAIKPKSDAQIIAEGTSKVADAFYEQKVKRDEASMLKGLTDIEIQTTAYLDKLALEGTGSERTVFEVANEEFKKVSDSFIESQPSHIKSQAEIRMLGIQESVARSALGIQARQEAERLKVEAKDTFNNLTNMTRMGTMAENAALARGEEYIQTLPASVQGALRQELNESIKLASLNNLADQNPSAAIAAIKSGGYNEVSPSSLNSVLSSSISKIEAANNRALVLQNKALELQYTDPYTSAGALLQSRGINPNSASANEIEAAYDALGTPPNLRFQMSKDMANATFQALKAMPDKESFYSMFNAKLQAYTVAGRSPAEFINAMTYLSDAPPAMKALALYNPDGATYDSSMSFNTDVLYDLVQNPKAGSEALSVLAAEDKDYKKEISAAVVNKISEYSSTSGALSSAMDSGEALQYFTDSISVAAFRVRAANPSLSASEVVEIAVNKVDSGSPTKAVSGGRNYYRVPKEYEGVITPKLLNSISSDIILSGNSAILDFGGNKLINEAERKREAATSGWRSSDGINFNLMNQSGHSVLRINPSTGKPEPIVMTLDEILLQATVRREMEVQKLLQQDLSNAAKDRID